MIICSYFTPGNYEEVMNTYLRPCLEKYNLRHHIEKVEDLKNWNANTSFKPTFILNMLNKYQEDVVFLDADASIHEFPQLLFDLPENTDLACFFLNWWGHWRNDWSRTDRMHLLSGTLFIKYNQKMLDLVKQWIEKCRIDSRVWEQKVLQSIVESRKDLNVYKLPASYCAVVDRQGNVPKYVGKGIIVHHQVSRVYKYKRN